MRLSTYIFRTLALLWVLVVAIGVLVFVGVNRVAQSDQAVQRTQAEGKQVEVMLKGVVDLETGVRGYIITGDPAFLQPYTAAKAALPQQFEALGTQLAAGQDEGDAAQLALVARLRGQLRAWQRDIAAPEIAARALGAAPRRELGSELGSAQQGKRLFDQMRATFAALQNDLERDLARHRQAGARTLRAVQRLTLLGLCALIGASVLIAVVLARQLSGTFGRLAHATRRLSEGHLEERAPVLGPREARQLALNFNRMADALQGAQHELRERNAQLVRAAQDSARLAALSDALQVCYTLNEGYAVLERSLPQLFSGWSGAVAVIAASRNLTEVKVQWGAGAWRSADPTARLEACWALRRGAAYSLDDPMSMPCPQQGEECDHTYLCLPLIAQGDAIGTLRLSAADRPLKGEDIARARAFAQVVAKQVALAIANLQLRDTLHQQSVRDPLTRLHNRRYLEETLTRELPRAARQGSPLGVLTLDIDHFKSFNDTFGHEGGDAMLRAFARCVQEFFRAEDITCRYGGEEFVVVLPDSGHAQTLERAEGFRRAVSRLSVTHKGTSLGQVTVSVGVASFPEHGRERDALLESADRALYQAKRAGRDRVVSVNDVGEAPRTR